MVFQSVIDDRCFTEVTSYNGKVPAALALPVAVSKPMKFDNSIVQSLYLKTNDRTWRSIWRQCSMEGSTDGHHVELARDHHGYDRRLHCQLGQYQCIGG